MNGTKPIMLNFGCGGNYIEGWQNHDADVDITKPLPFGDGIADFVFAEHVVEHVTYEQALSFFRESHRVLRSGGVIRIAVPSVERIWQYADENYMKFVSRWTNGEVSRRAAIDAILHAHGHQAPWTSGLLSASLYFAGFDHVAPCTPGHSIHLELREVEGHGKVIGDHFNLIETAVSEGTK